jgi:hypothetical protein
MPEPIRKWRNQAQPARAGACCRGPSRVPPVAGRAAVHERLQSVLSGLGPGGPYRPARPRPWRPRAVPFARDRRNASSCYGGWAAAWPPDTVNRAPKAGTGVRSGLRRTARRGNGSLQVTYAGHLLYGVTNDNKPGQIVCQNVSDCGGWALARRQSRRYARRLAPPGTAARLSAPGHDSASSAKRTRPRGRTRASLQQHSARPLSVDPVRPRRADNHGRPIKTAPGLAGRLEVVRRVADHEHALGIELAGQGRRAGSPCASAHRDGVSCSHTRRSRRLG